MRKFLKRWARELARDDGVAGLVMATVIAVVAFTALMVVLNTYLGGRALERLQASNKRGIYAFEAVMSNYLSQSTTSRRILCPDTDFDGSADVAASPNEADCEGGTTGTLVGTLPWKDLGLSRNEAIDAYGNYYTYVVPAAAATRQLCLSIGNDYDEDEEVAYTGSLVEQTALYVRTTASTDERYVPFVIVGHGPNGLGAYNKAQAAQQYPDSASERQNSAFDAEDDPTTPAFIYTGPYDPTDPASGGTSTKFDDEVYAPSTEDLLAVCEQLTPGGQMNADLSDNFDSGATINDDKFDTSESGTDPTVVKVNGDGVASFTDGTSLMATHSDYDFTTAVRPVYVAAYWTPRAVPNTFSIATRATMPPTNGTNDFAVGLTFQFGATTINISNSEGLNVSSSAFGFTLTADEEYLLEVYDNGDDVWARITQRDTPANTVSVTTSTTDDLTGDQRVVFINGTNPSYIDDVVVGFPMLAADFNGTSSYASADAGDNDFDDVTPDLTIEAWINPGSYPDTGEASAIVAKWNTATEATPALQGYRLYMNSGELHLRLAGTNATDTIVRTFDSGLTPELNTWTHVAVTYDQTTGTARFYKNGELARAVVNSDMVGRWANDTATQPLRVGADGTTTAADFYDGAVSDVRVWEVARSAPQIRDCYNTRIPSTDDDCAATDIIANWRFDPTQAQGGIASTGTAYASHGDDGSIIGVSYVATLSRYFRPFSTDFCPSGTKVGVYQCDFRTVASSTTDGVNEPALDIPGNLQALYVKAWGGGGGAYEDGDGNSSVGGGGGFSAAVITEINGTAIGNVDLDVIVGGGGTGSRTDDNNGAGGGGASGVAFGSSFGLVAGGGGGASYSAADNSEQDDDGMGTVAINCDGELGEETQCGFGGGGGGAGASAGADTVQANHNATGCGGHGGDNTPTSAIPPDPNKCSAGGISPTGTPTTNGGGDADDGPSGGASAIGAGGRGHNPTNHIGGGGGGGGASGGESGGYAVQHDSGFGGGGGSGSADSVAANVSGERGSVGSDEPEDDVDDSLVGTPNADGQNATQRSRVSIDAGYEDELAAIASLIDNKPISDSIGCIPDGAIITDVNTGADYIEMNVEAEFPDGVTDCSGSTIYITITDGGSAILMGVAGGNGDDDYAPDYAVGTNAAPGRGGYAGASNIDGLPGAVVLKW